VGSAAVWKIDSYQGIALAMPFDGIDANGFSRWPSSHERSG